MMPISHRVRQQRQVSQKLRRNLRAARIWAQPMRTPWANDIWASRSSAAMPILPDPSGVAGVSVSAATAFTGAAERRRNRSPTEQDATVHNIKCGKLSVQVLADGADPRVAEHRRDTHTVSPLADTRGFETRAARQEMRQSDLRERARLLPPLRRLVCLDSRI